MGFFWGGGRREDKCGNMENLNKSDGKTKNQKTKKQNIGESQRWLWFWEVWILRGIVKADSLGSKNFLEPTRCRPCRCPATCVDEWCKDSLVDDTTTRQMAQHALYDPSAKKIYDLPPCSHFCDSVSVLSVDKDPLFCIETRSLSHVACDNLRQRTWLSPLSPLQFSYLIAGHRACSQQVLKRTVRPLEASQLRKIRSKMLNHAVDKGANKQPLSRDES